MPATILLIEDNAHNARLVIRALSRHSYRVVHAEDAETGLQMAIQEQPDLVLLDLGLPDFDGQTLVPLLRHQAGLTDVPIVAVTAWPLETVEPMASAYGCDDYISKPFSPRELLLQIEDYLEPLRVDAGS